MSTNIGIDSEPSALLGRRRPHLKSRNGCKQCKQRKIKCDESKPSCGHCRRYQASCSYTGLIPFTSSVSPVLNDTVRPSSSASPKTPERREHHRSHSSAPSEIPQLSLSTNMEVKNLELLHFYTTTTSFTLSDRPELQKIWQTVVPQIAFEHHFLLHGILAFSALHLARSHPTRKASLYSEASTHHDMGLRLFQLAMSDITPQNCDASFAFSSLIAAYAWASSEQTGDLFFTSEKDGGSNVEWVSLLCGVYTLLIAAGDWMTSSPLRLILQPRSLDFEVAQASDPDRSAKLMALRELWAKASSDRCDAREIDTLDQTLDLLHEACGQVALSSVDDHIDVILVVYGWPIKVPESFFGMVKEGKPEALILLALYSLLLNEVNHLWYMQGMSRRLLQTVHGKIGKDWERWMAWPLQDLVLTEFKDTGEGIAAL